MKAKLGDHVKRTARQNEQASTFDEDISEDDRSQMTDSSIIKILRLGPRNPHDKPVKATLNFSSFDHGAFPPIGNQAVV